MRRLHFPAGILAELFLSKLLHFSQLWWVPSLLNRGFQLFPQMFSWIKIRAHSRRLRNRPASLLLILSRLFWNVYFWGSLLYWWSHNLQLFLPQNAWIVLWFHFALAPIQAHLVPDAAKQCHSVAASSVRHTRGCCSFLGKLSLCGQGANLTYQKSSNFVLCIHCFSQMHDDL